MEEQGEVQPHIILHLKAKCIYTNTSYGDM